MGCSEGPSAPATPLEIQTERMLRSEALLLSWNKTGKLKDLGRAMEGMEWPGPLCAELFTDDFVFQELVTDESPTQPILVKLDGGDGGVDYQEFRSFEDLLAQVDYFKKAKFKIHLPVPEWVDPNTMRQWKASLMFVAKAKMKNGKLAAISGWNETIWDLDPADYDEENPDDQNWRCSSWKVTSLSINETEDWLFEEVLDQVIPDGNVRELARRSLHEDMVTESLQATREGNKFEAPYDGWQLVSAERHPSVSVVDHDQDGWDDFYIMERQGKNLFFHNRGDGTFEEIGADLGLDIDGKTSSAAFADFDNDGDLDLFLGGALRRSMVMENVDGRFVDRTGDWIAAADLPYHTSSISIVDYDGDGLNDIYCSTYAAFFVNRAFAALGGKSKSERKGKGAITALRKYLAQPDWEELESLVAYEAANQGLHTNRPGPPNILLRNLGNGKFAPAPEAENLRLFYNSYQTTWSDFDNDGDPDMYVANDFAPNFMFQNQGDGTFVDITDASQVEDIGFGMAVSFGDYDNDGFQDLYVANMFSKAARRVTSFFTVGRANYDAALLQGEGVDPLIEQLGRGNSLFRNEGPGYAWEKVSEVGSPMHVVEKAGWCWGAQFADFNNDGWLDIYAPAGYYTAPQEEKRDVDL
ncbi:MAG: FG-GAP repeat domain-containing protein [Planctomycetota bacterium]